MKICLGCFKNTNNFGKHKSGKFGLKSKCRPCLAKIGKDEYRQDPEKFSKRNKLSYQRNKKVNLECNRRWTKANKERSKENHRLWRIKNKQKLRERGLETKKTANNFDKVKILKKQKGKCIYCRQNKGPFQFDHVVPFSKGGKRTESNIVVACRPCNARKKDMSIQEFKRHSQILGYKLPNSKLS